MSEIEVQRTDLVQEEAVVDISSVLMRLEALPVRTPVDTLHPSPAMLSALSTLCRGSTALQTALRSAAQAGEGLMVTFPPDVVKGLQSGALSLMKSSRGAMPIAVDGSGRIVAHAAVVGGVGASAAATGVGTAAVGVSASALAVAALPIVIAGAAAYAQQPQLERSLKDIKEIVQRIEERLEDTDSGACDAAERFLELAQDV